jgi:flavodoxin
MKALVVYESLFGNTEKIARSIADALGQTFDVTLADVSTMPRAFDADLIVLGGPTHAFGMSRQATREHAVEQGAERTAAVSIGLREYLERSPTLPGVAAATFDTKVEEPFLPGSAAHRAQRRLRRLGCRIAVPAESFLVAGTRGPLKNGEEKRAWRWGAAVAAAVADGC